MPAIRRESSNGRKSQAACLERGEARHAAADGGKLIVLSAPLTEIIDHAGYFIQMALASIPIWMERVLDNRYPNWRRVEYNPDGSARYMPAGTRLVEKSLQRFFPSQDIVACYPDDVEKFIGPRN